MKRVRFTAWGTGEGTRWDAPAYAVARPGESAVEAVTRAIETATSRLVGHAVFAATYRPDGRSEPHTHHAITLCRKSGAVVAQVWYSLKLRKN